MLAVPPFPRHDDPVRRWRVLAPDRVALIDRRRDRRLTYAELDAEADRWRWLLASMGVGAGDRVATLAGTRPEQVALLHGCLRLGAALVPLNWRLAAPELARVLESARPRVLVGEPAFRALAEAAWASPDARTAARWIDLDDEAPARLRRARDDGRPDHRGGPEEAALVLYTSGTTGEAKGAVSPRRQLFYNAVATCLSWQLGAADVGAVATPLFHTGGWGVYLGPLLHAGGTSVLFDRFDADDWLEGMAAEGCTVAFAVPTQLAMARERPAWGRPLPRLRYLVSGGAPCPPDLMAAVRSAGVRVRDAFGMTECGPNCFATSDEAARARPGSVGWPIAFLEMRLTRDDGRPAAPDEPGELELRGPQLFAGYLGDPTRTAEAMTADGWLRTGDLARADADGCYTICGRRKEMFISGGENVFPAEVEAVLVGCPGVREAAVVAMPDPRWGEVGHAYVAPRPGCPLDEAAVLAHARGRLAGYKVPRAVVVVDALPRLGSGKVDRARLLADARDETRARWTAPGPS